MQSSNPVLKQFEKPQTWDQLGQAPGQAAALDDAEKKLGVMTMSGTVLASSTLLGICVATAFATWAFMPARYMTIAMFGGILVGLGFALVIAFKPRTAPFLGPVAAVLEGVFVGAASMMYAAWIGSMEMSEAGSASMRMLAGEGSHLITQAVLLTFGVFAGMLIAYSTRVIRATPALIKGIMAATFGVAFLMVGWLVLSMFASVPSMAEMGWLGVGIAGVIVVIAAFNLILDFHVIEQGVKHEAPKHMEWMAAFGLMVTLVWLYVSILRLLALLAFNRE